MYLTSVPWGHFIQLSPECPLKPSVRSWLPGSWIPSACNLLLKAAESRSKQFVELLREQSSREGRTGGCSTAQGSTAVSLCGTITSGDTESPLGLLTLCLSHCRNQLCGREIQSKPGFSDQGQCCGKEEAIWSALSWPFQILHKD